MTTRLFKTNNVDDTEMIYSLLREKYPNKEICIEYNDNTKTYILELTNLPFKEDPTIPLDVKIKVIYGDSQTSDSSVILRDPNTGLVYIETFKNIFDESKKVEYPGFKIFDKSIKLEKEYSTTHYQVWTDIGWQNIKKVIRHKCDKKIFTIATHTGYVTVTEDHSLLNENLEILTPTECTYNTKLLQSYPTTFYSSNNITKNKAYIYGFFYNYGTLNKCILNKHNGVKYILSFTYNDITVLQNLYTLLRKEYGSDVVIINLTNSRLTLHPCKSMIEEFCNMESGSVNVRIDKKIPTSILNSHFDIIDSFFYGFSASKIKLCNSTTFFIKGQIGASGFYYLLTKMGYKVSLEYEQYHIFKLTITRNFSSNKTTNQINRIQLQKPNSATTDFVYDFVYDLETECGRYQAGVGNIICKNTDSIFLSLKFNRDSFDENRKDTFKLATICGDNITDKVFNRQPIVLEFEKVFQPFILLTKKRYIGKKFENMKDPFKLKEITKSGIAITRRDYCKMVKNCYTEVIDSIFDGCGVEESIEIYKSYIDKIDNYQIDVEDLVVSAMLASKYKTKPVHVQLAEKLKKRNEEVQVGDRISYIYIENTSGIPKQKSELGENPLYAKNNNLKYNRGCYLSQLAKPLLGFFKVTLDEHQDMLNDIIEYTNTKLSEYNEPKLKPSDYKISE